MKLGAAVRSMGPQARPDTLLACVRAAEAAGLDHVWIQDHVAIPPDDAEGSGGYYLDPLTALAWLAARTERIGLGTGVLILPYRPPLPTAKAIATVQELSGGRLLLGVGVGWMQAEFTALGVPRAERGARTDATLEFLGRAFADDVVEEHGQKFLFLPRPPRPPIYVGGAAPHALERAVRHGDGWMPMGGDPAELAGPIRQLRELAARAGRPTPETVLLTFLDPRDPGRAAQTVGALADAGVSQLVAASRYTDAREFAAVAAFLGEHVLPACRDAAR
jgi:probable F420-dependent oxidoreductase